MKRLFDSLAFGPADILLPRDCDLTKWAVVACDQYTAQPEYWTRVEERVGNAPSALRLILPESCLEGPNVETDIVEANGNMAAYLREGRFQELEDALVYVERTLRSGLVRRGLVGQVDLEQYDGEPGSDAPVRGAEGTVMGQIPPRVLARKNAPLELSHVFLLCDDPQRTVIDPLAARKDRMELLYDFDLMEEGGHVAGWKVDEEGMALVAQALGALTAGDSLQLAVGDGNHALTAAKECYERQKTITPPERWDTLPARYALCELVNIHDEALRFEPIHRLLRHVKGEELRKALLAAFPGAKEEEGGELAYVWAGGTGHISIPHGEEPLLSLLQPFLDDYVRDHGGSIGYIHGSEVAAGLGARPGNFALLLPAPDREGLFPLLRRGESLPRKAFSVREANDKRFYLECRRIR